MNWVEALERMDEPGYLDTFKFRAAIVEIFRLRDIISEIRNKATI